MLAWVLTWKQNLFAWRYMVKDCGTEFAYVCHVYGIFVGNNDDVMLSRRRRGVVSLSKILS